MSLRRYTRAVPFNYEGYGMYRLGVTSGIIPATPLAAGEIFQFRWNPTDRAIIAVITRIRLSAAITTTNLKICQVNLLGRWSHRHEGSSVCTLLDERRDPRAARCAA